MRRASLFTVFYWLVKLSKMFFVVLKHSINLPFKDKNLSFFNKKVLKNEIKYVIVSKNSKARDVMNNNKLVDITKIFLDIMFYIGIITWVSLPWSMKYFGRIFTIYQEFYFPLIFVFEVAGFLGVIIIWKLRQIFKTVRDQNCFVRENVEHLKIMGMCSFGITILMACRLFFVVTPSILVLILVFLLAGLFSLVLSQVFKVAINYKEENDLTV